jgi:hypothetical protein
LKLLATSLYEDVIEFTIEVTLFSSAAGALAAVFAVAMLASFGV